MKPDSNEPLSDLLKTWRVDAVLPPGFERNVWRRIDVYRASPKWNIRELVAHWIGSALPRPSLAAGYIAVLMLMGIGAGWGRAQQESARVKGELGARYVQVLDPYLPGH